MLCTRFFIKKISFQYNIFTKVKYIQILYLFHKCNNNTETPLFLKMIQIYMIHVPAEIAHIMYLFSVTTADPVKNTPSLFHPLQADEQKEE